MLIFHVVESLIGGPASYLDEILPYQIEKFGNENVVLILPKQHLTHVPRDFKGKVYTFERPRRGLRALISLAMTLRAVVRTVGRPDILHLHSTLAGIVGRLAIIRIGPRTKVVYCAHCWYFDRLEKSPFTKLAEIVERILIARTHAVVNISRHESELLRGLRFSQKKMHTIETGLADVSNVDEALPFDAARSPLRLLYLGRFDRQKGLDLLINAIAQLDLAKVSITIVGSNVVGGDSIELPRGGNVEVLGWVPRRDVHDLIRRHHFVIMPSRWEGMPITALEAFRAGRPIIGNDIPALRTLMGYSSSEKPGVLLKFDRSDSLHRFIDSFEMASWPQLCVNARALFVKRFTAKAMLQELEELYIALIDPASTVGRSVRSRVRLSSPSPSVSLQIELRCGPCENSCDLQHGRHE